MAILEKIDVCRHIHQHLENLPEAGEEELRFLLESAEAKLLAFVENGQYDTDKHGVSIATAAAGDEGLTQKLSMALTDFPFLQGWTVGEFASFLEAQAHYIALKKPKKKRGRPRKTTDDIAKQHAQFKAQIEQCLPGIRYNMMTGEYQHLRIDPQTGSMYYYSLHGDDLQLLGERLLLNHGIRIPDETATKIFKIIAKEPDNIYYPQVEMLEIARSKFPDMTEADAHEFFEGFGIKMFGVFPDEPSINGVPLRDAAIKKFLVAMAKLARFPGTTPQWMPILIGGQGAGKSFFVKHLIPEQFRSLSGEVKTDMQRIKNEAYRLHTAFIHEFPEIDAQMTPRNIEALKNLVTGDVDECRRPYAALPEKLIRQFAFIGTSNRDDLFVEGSGQRRYVPIQCPLRWRIPWFELRDTDLVWQLWAAADVIAKTYDRKDIYLRSWTKGEEDIIFGWQTRFTQVDPMEHAVIDWIASSGKRRFTTGEMLGSLNISVGSMSDSGASRRVATILRNHYGDAAQKVFIMMPNGKKVRGWEITAALEDFPPPPPPDEGYTLKTVPQDPRDF